MKRGIERRGDIIKRGIERIDIKKGWVVGGKMCVVNKLEYNGSIL